MPPALQVPIVATGTDREIVEFILEDWIPSQQEKEMATVSAGSGCDRALDEMRPVDLSDAVQSKRRLAQPGAVDKARPRTGLNATVPTNRRRMNTDVAQKGRMVLEHILFRNCFAATEKKARCAGEGVQGGDAGGGEGAREAAAREGEGGAGAGP